MPPISVMMKPASGNCNMKCDYCFYCDEAQKRSQESYGFMSEQTLKNVIRKTMLRAEGMISYTFQGGEPTLRGIEFFQKAVAYQKQYNKNAVTVDEEELIQALQEYFQEILSKKKKVINYVIKEFQRVYKAKDENIEYEKQLNTELNKLRKSCEKYMDMYTDDLISREELNEKIGGMRKEIERLENELKMVSYHLTKGEQLEAILNSTFKQLEDITDVHEMTNAQLKRLINKIEVDKDGNVDIYLRLIGDLGLDETVLIEGDENTEEKGIKTVSNSCNHT
jgi:organic radical activating enzyme